MADFQVGDRVRAIPGDFTDGEEGVITSIEQVRSGTYISITQDDGYVSADFLPNELELVA